MNKKKVNGENYLVKIILLAMLLFSFSYTSIAQLITRVDNAANLVQNVLVGAGVKINKVDFIGAPVSIGYFDGSKSNIGLSKGIVITTGTIYGNEGPIGPNNSASAGMDNGFGGNAMLNQIIANETKSGVEPKNTFNSATLKITFKPISDTVRFRYVFGSEEYPEFVGSEFNDLFAFFISGPGIIGQKNIALLPNGTPVTINNVNDQNSPNAAYYVNNRFGSTVQYDGFTRVLTAMSPVQCGQEYTLIISIADVSDAAFDSGIFLEANSLSAKVELGLNLKISKDNFNDTLTMAEGCTSGKITLKKMPGSKDKQYDIPVIYKGSATQGVDYTTTAPTVLTIPQGQESTTFEIVSLQDNIKEGLDSILMDLILPDACGNTYIETKKFYIKNIEPITIDMPDDTIFCVGKGKYIVPKISGGLKPYSFEWDTNAKTDSMFVNPPANNQYTLKVTDVCFNSATKTNTVVVMKYLPLLVAPLANITEICPYLPTKVIANASQGAGFYKYSWKDDKKIVDTQKEGTLKPSKTTYYTLTVLDRCGEMKSVSFLYTITSPPLIPHLSPDTIICYGDSVMLEASAKGGYGKYTFKWIPSFDTTNRLWVKPKSSVDYFIYVGDDCKTFTVRDTATIIVNRPSVNFIYQGIPIINNEIQFINLSPKYSSYSWDFGNGKYSILREDKTFYEDSSLYDVTLTIKDSIGCTNSITQKIQINFPYSLYIPNVFTPNGDGINDYFIPSLTSVVSVDLSLYNRWGEVIYSSNELRPRWDGTYNGIQSPNDVYTYKIQVITILGKLEIYTGHVTLWR